MWLISLSGFFFSSRRRHTRCLSDWSSDVCSSDLLLQTAKSFGGGSDTLLSLLKEGFIREAGDGDKPVPAPAAAAPAAAGPMSDAEREIGRASCRERVEMAVGAGACRKESEGDCDT